MAKQDAVTRATEDEGGGWTFACPHFPVCEFTSRGWRTKELATTRGEQHEAEHQGEATTPELATFRAEVGE